MKKKTIESLNISLIKEGVEDAYDKAKKKYIAEETYYQPSSFLQSSRYAPDPVRAEATWNARYPKGFRDWEQFNYHGSLNPIGQQMLIDKINELVSTVNEIIRMINP